jgi:hypothetical protein
MPARRTLRAVATMLCLAGAGCGDGHPQSEAAGRAESAASRSEAAAARLEEAARRLETLAKQLEQRNRGRASPP